MNKHLNKEDETNISYIITCLKENIRNLACKDNYCNLEKIFAKIKDDNVIVFESLINYYLEDISNFKISDVSGFINSVEKLSSFFDFAYFIYGNKEKRQSYLIQECGEKVADDLIAKFCFAKERSIDLPLNLETLTQYSISYKIKKKDMSKTFIWIILRLSIADYLLNEK